MEICGQGDHSIEISRITCTAEYRTNGSCGKALWHISFSFYVMSKIKLSPSKFEQMCLISYEVIFTDNAL